jgi:catechol 2,3-dioxygenase-like lactoylglutathione lyase family enzyme
MRTPISGIKGGSSGSPFSFKVWSDTMQLNHVALTVSNRERSAVFYGKWFGLTKRVHHDDHILIVENEAGALLALSEGQVPPQPPRTTHFGFQVDAPKTVHEIRKQFAKAGIEEAEWQDYGPTRIQVYDPDGYRVEVYAY